MAEYPSGVSSSRSLLLGHRLPCVFDYKYRAADRKTNRELRMFPNCFIYSANGMFSPINGIAPPPVSTFESHAHRPASRAAPRADIKKSPRPTCRGAGRETRRRIYIRLTRTRKNEAPDQANKKERSKKNANGNADGDDENESEDGKHSPRKSSDDSDYLTEYEHRVFTLGESEERDDEKNNISNLRNSRE